MDKKSKTAGPFKKLDFNRWGGSCSYSFYQLPHYIILYRVPMVKKNNMLQQKLKVC